MIGIALFLLLAQGEKSWDDRPGAVASQSQQGAYNVELVGWVKIGAAIDDLVASEDGRAIYVNTDSAGLIVVDISDPSNPYLYKVIRHDSLRRIGPIARVENYLYVWWYDWYYKSIVVIYEWDAYDISDALNPIFIKTVYYYEGPETKPIGRWWNALPPDPVHDTIFYAVGHFLSFNVKDPLNPQLLGIRNDPSTKHYFLYPYDYGCYSDTPYAHYYIFDLSDPRNMRLVCHDSIPASYYDIPGSVIMSIAVWERPSDRRRFMYLLGYYYSRCFDVTDPTNPVLLKRWGYWEWGGWCGNASMVHEDKLYSGENKYPSGEIGLVVRSPSPDPTNPSIVGYYYHEAGDSVRGPYNPMLWVNGYIVASAEIVSERGRSPGIAIYRYTTDVPPPDTAVEYLDWITTVYKQPGLSFSISQKSHVSFKLYNILGQKAYERDLGILEPGPHSVRLPDMGPGVYFLFLKANKATLRKKIIFLR